MVRKTVTPSSFARRRDLLPERGPALDVEAGGRLVEEEDARAVDEREREVEPALHPAGVAAHLAVGSLGQADALEQLVGARPALGARQRLQARLEPQVLAAGEQRIERGLLQRGADHACAPPGPASTTSKPPTRARPDGGRQQRRQHQHGGRLAGAVRARGSRRSRRATTARSIPSTARGPFLNSRTSASASIACSSPTRPVYERACGWRRTQSSPESAVAQGKTQRILETPAKGERRDAQAPEGPGGQDRRHLRAAALHARRGARSRATSFRRASCRPTSRTRSSTTS